MSEQVNETNVGWPVDPFTDDDLDGIVGTIKTGQPIDPSVILQLVAEVQKLREEKEQQDDARLTLAKLEKIAREHWDTELAPNGEEPEIKGFTFIKFVLVELSRGYGQLRPLLNVIDEAEKSIRVHYGGRGKADQLRHILRELEWRRDKAQNAFAHLTEDMLVWTRAMGLAANMAANGGTHREKDARMRGLIEMTESAVEAIRKAKEQTRDYFGYNVPDIFRSDYPVRDYVQRIHHLENELKHLRGDDQNGSDQQGDDGTESVF
jgi:hypothetical protein